MKKLILTLALVAMGSIAYAQSDNISANAAVQTPITVTGGDNIEFGDVFPGVNKTIAPTSTAAGSFSIAGQASASVDLTFTLPTNLVSGPNNLPIIYTNALIINESNIRTGSAQTPVTATPITTNLAGDGNLYAFLGGTVQPISTLPSGSYTATITLAVAYN